MTIGVFVQGLDGRMGQAVQALIDASPEYALRARVAQAEAVIDFSRPAGTFAVLEQCLASSVPLVTGTTALQDDWRRARDAAASRLPILEAPNMSIGVNLIYLLLETAAASIGNEADIDIIETHHRHKVDAPSGTALHMGQVIEDALAAVRRAAGDEIKVNYHSVRAGDVPGEHRVTFTLAGERVEVGHVAMNRAVFALGALRAAKWIQAASPGVYSMRDVLRRDVS